MRGNEPLPVVPLGERHSMFPIPMRDNEYYRQVWTHDAENQIKLNRSA